MKKDSKEERNDKIFKAKGRKRARIKKQEKEMKKEKRR